MKFKVGDKVRVKRFKECPRYWNSEGKMNHLMGKVVSITEILRDGCRVYDEVHKRLWYIKEQDFEPVNETIVIYRKDQKVIALDKSTGKKAIARCCPKDTFNFETGAKLAFARLMEEDKPHVKIVKCDKYEVGDKVLIKSWDQMEKEYGLDEDGDINCRFTFVSEMREYCEKIVTINSFKYPDCYMIAGEYCKFSADMFAGKVIEDTAEDQKQQLYNGKIIFTKGDDIFKTGHIYEIKDGKIECPDVGRKLPGNERLFKTIDDVKDYFTGFDKRQRRVGWSFETLGLIEVQDD